MLGTYGQHLVAPHGALRVCNDQIVAPHGALRVCNDQKRQLEDDLRAVSVVGPVSAPEPPPRQTCRAHRPPTIGTAQRAADSFRQEGCRSFRQMSAVCLR